MALDPNVLLGTQPVRIASPLEAYVQYAQLRNLANQDQWQQQQIEAATMENRQRQIALQDQQTLRQAFVDANGDPDRMLALAAARGASPGALFQLRTTLLDQKTKAAALDKDTLANAQTRNDQLQSLLAPVAAESDPVKQQQAWDNAVGQAVARGLIQPQDAARYAYPGPEGVKTAAAQLNLEKWTLSEQQQARAEQAQTQAQLNRAKLPGAAAQAQFQVLQNAVAQLAAAPPRDAQEYVQRISQLDPQTAVAILRAVPVSRYDPVESIRALRALGETPVEQQTAGETERHNVAEEALSGQRNAIEQQNANTNRQRLGVEQYNAGLGPDGKPLSGLSLTGEDFLKTLPPGMQLRVKAIAEGRELPLTGRAAASGAGRQLMEAVTQYDPGWSVQRAQLRSAFTGNSKDGRNIGALNTAVAHIDQYVEALKALQNGTFRPGNQVWNNFKATFGAGAPTTAQGIANAVAGETANALKGDATDPEIAAVRAAMPQNGSPQQIADYAKSQLHVLGAKLNTYDERYQALAPGDPWSPVLPTARAVFAKYGIQPLTRFGGGPNSQPFDAQAARKKYHY